jgi:hypothetical protein
VRPKNTTYKVRLFLARVQVRLTDALLYMHVRLVCGLGVCHPADTAVDTLDISDQLHGSCYTTVSTMKSERVLEHRRHRSAPKQFPPAAQYTASGRLPVVQTRHRGDPQAKAAGQRMMSRTRGCHERVDRSLGREYMASAGEGRHAHDASRVHDVPL